MGIAVEVTHGWGTICVVGIFRVPFDFDLNPLPVQEKTIVPLFGLQAQALAVSLFFLLDIFLYHILDKTLGCQNWQHFLSHKRNSCPRFKKRASQTSLAEQVLALGSLHLLPFSQA